MHKRINIDIDRFKYAYPNTLIQRQGNDIMIKDSATANRFTSDSSLQCFIVFDENYPYVEPKVFVNHNNVNYS